MDDSDADQREEHRLNPNQPVSLEELAKVRVVLVGGVGGGWVGRSIDNSSKESGGTRGTGNALTPLPHTPLPNPADRRALLDLRRGHVQDGRQVRGAFR